MSKRILVVEDQADNRRILRDMLSNAGYELVEAESGEEALMAVEEQRPDLILMDIQLPVMDGYEATRRIKSNPTLKAVPIIAVTSYALSGDEAKRGQQAATPTSPSPLVPVRCSQKCVSSCREHVSMHSPPRILIVDDNETNRDLLITRLGTHGFDLLLSKSVISAKHETDLNVWRQPPGTHLNWN